MTTAEMGMPRAPGRTMDRLPWIAGLIVALALALRAFWFLLGYQCSPENYQTRIADLGTTGLAVFGVVLVLALAVAVRMFRCDVLICRRTLLGSLPLVAAASIIVGKTLVGFPMRFYDVLLFSLTCGSAASVGARGMKCLESEESCLWPAIVWAGVFAFGGYFFWQQIGYLNNLALGYHDCGEAARMMYNSLHNPRELFLRINPDKPLFLDHFQPGVLLFVPLWALLPRVELTIVFQVAATIGAALPLYAIARERWNDKVSALLLVIGWLAYPSVSQLIYNASYGFYWGRFCLPLYFVALWLWLKGRNGMALAVMLWAVFVKEEAAIFLGMFGTYLALFQRQRRTGVVLAISGFAYFWIVTTFVIPTFGGGRYEMLSYFSGLGEGHQEILLAPLTRAGQFWGRLFEPASFYLLGCLLVPLLCLPLRKPSVLVIASIPFLFICEWNNPNVKSICFWYQTGLLPILFWALVEALRDASTTEKLMTRRTTMLGVVVAGATLSIFCGNTFWSKDGTTTQLAPGRLAAVKHMGVHIDPAKTLVATERVAAHFVMQKYLYIEPTLPSRADYVLMDFRDGWRTAVGVERLRELRAFQRQVESQAGLNLLAVEDGLVLYGREGTPLNVSTVVERDSLPSNVVREVLPVGHGVSIAGYAITALPPANKQPGQRLRVTTFESVAQRVDVDLAVRAVLTFGSGQSQAVLVSPLQPLGQCVWPTHRWEPGKFYVDEFTIDVPPGMAGLSCTVGFAAERLDGPAR